MGTSNNPLTNLVRAGVEKACREFSLRVEPLGFLRTLKMHWTRRHPLTVDFIRLYRGGGAYPPLNASVDIGINFGIRVLNDSFDAIAVNGPDRDYNLIRAGRYHMRFNARSGSTFDRCVDDLTRYVVDLAEPWFQRWNSVKALLESPDSPLRPEEKEFLRAARDGHASTERVAASLKMLGIKGP